MKSVNTKNEETTKKLPKLEEKPSYKCLKIILRKTNVNSSSKDLKEKLKLYLIKYILKHEEFELQLLDNESSDIEIKYLLDSRKPVVLNEALKNIQTAGTLSNHQVKIEPVEPTSRIIFQSLKDNEYIKLFFENEIKSDGQININNIQDFYLIEFQDYKHVDRIINRNNFSPVTDKITKFHEDYEGFKAYVEKNSFSTLKLNKKEFPYNIIFNQLKSFKEYLNNNNIDFDENLSEIKYLQSNKELIEKKLNNYKNKFSFFEKNVKKEIFDKVKDKFKTYETSELLVRTTDDFVRIEGTKEQIELKRELIEKEILKIEEEANFRYKKSVKYPILLGRFFTNNRSFTERILDEISVKHRYEVNENSQSENKIFENEQCTITIHSIDEKSANTVKEWINSKFKFYMTSEEANYLMDSLNDYLIKKLELNKKTENFIFKKSAKYCFAGEKELIDEIEKEANNYIKENRVYEKKSEAFAQNKLQYLNKFKKKTIHDECVSIFKETKEFVSIFFDKKSDEQVLIITAKDDTRKQLESRIKKLLENVIVESCVVNISNIDLKNIGNETKCFIYSPPQQINITNRKVEIISDDRNNVNMCKERLGY